MEKSKDKLIAELNNLQQKYSALEAKFQEETERLKKEGEELRIRLLFFEGIANSTIDGFLVVDTRGQKILQTQRTIDLWKIPQEVVADLRGDKQVAHVMHMTVDPQKFIAEIHYQMMHPEEIRLDDVELIDGTIMERYSSPVIGPDGIHYGRIYTFHDITELKKIERQLLQLNVEKDRFISILAHDLRSPFNSLLGFSEILKNELRHMSVEKAEEMVKIVYHTALKTNELLEDTLLWASFQTKKITFTPVETSISEVVFEVIDILEPNAKMKDISVDSNIDKKAQVTSDVYMLKAVLRNLISNAIKFTNPGGRVNVSAVQEPRQTIIKVSDNGVGIKPEIRGKLFSFSAVQSSPGTADERGTGLGLLLCKEFVEKHGGKIWVDSTVDQGTTVSFTLPD
jgi:signal transduction histidine kinase